MTMIVPPIVLGRLRTVFSKITGLRRFRRASDEAWRKFAPSRHLLRMSVKMQLRPSNSLGRFAHNILTAGLPRPVRYLEVGAFEGASLILVHKLLDGQIVPTTIDPYEDYGEIKGCALSDAERAFDHNVAAMKIDGLRKIKGRSVDCLATLRGETFDLIYIDGSHETLDVMMDAVLAWPLLAKGGMMIFDDYRYDRQIDGVSYRPKAAVDAFVGMMGTAVEVVDVGGQVFIRRRA